ncbi:MAG: DUF134 domain-containing protein [Planctomycetota bacterium]
MARPFKNRQITAGPAATVYKPAGVPAGQLQWQTLALDELEAIRLADADGLPQEEIAERMGVSRPTVSRILTRARRTIAQALTRGEALQIEGGPVEFSAGGPQGGRGGRGHGGRGHGGRGRRRGRRRGRDA